MSRISHCLWFDTQAEEAAKFYVSVFQEKSKGSTRVGQISRYGKEGFEFHGKPEGSVMTVEFELDGAKYLGLNGGPHFKFNESVSICVDCETQEEIDYFWSALTKGGGEEVQCGWLKDRYGLSWQVVPTILAKMVADPDRARSGRVTNAYLHMKKFDIGALKRAYEGR